MLPHELERARMRFRLLSGLADENEAKIIQRILALIRKAQDPNLDPSDLLTIKDALEWQQGRLARKRKKNTT